MHRKFITLVLASAVAVTGLTAPARAGSEDLAKFLAGFTALVIIGSAIEDARDRKDVNVTRHNTYPPNTYNHPRHSHNKHQHTHKKTIKQPIKPKPLPPKFSRYNLPGECMRTFKVNRKNVNLLGNGCLKNRYSHVKSLPYACQFQFRTREGTRTGYEPVCLRERGYRISRR